MAPGPYMSSSSSSEATRLPRLWPRWAARSIITSVAGTVRVAEISGSESIVHVDVQGHNWVSQSHGVHSFRVGDTADLFVHIDRCLYFATGGAPL